MIIIIFHCFEILQHVYISANTIVFAASFKCYNSSINDGSIRGVVLCKHISSSAVGSNWKNKQFLRRLNSARNYILHLFLQYINYCVPALRRVSICIRNIRRSIIHNILYSDAFEFGKTFFSFSLSLYIYI